MGEIEKRHNLESQNLGTIPLMLKSFSGIEKSCLVWGKEARQAKTSPANSLF
jgi:hypothetical protein